MKLQLIVSPALRLLREVQLEEPELVNKHILEFLKNSS
jgi:hypothetical protein